MEGETGAAEGGGELFTSLRMGTPPIRESHGYACPRRAGDALQQNSTPPSTRQQQMLNDVFKVAAVWRLTSNPKQIAVNTFHYRTWAESAVSPSSPEDLLALWIAAREALYRAMVTTEATLVRYDTKRIWPTEGPKVETLRMVTGTRSGGELCPLQAAAIGTKLGMNPSPQRRGRIFFPWIMETDQAAGRLSDAYRTALLTWSGLWYAPFPFPTSPLRASYRDIIYSRVSHVTTDVDNLQVSQNAATIRRRRRRFP